MAEGGAVLFVDLLWINPDVGQDPRCRSVRLDEHDEPAWSGRSSLFADLWTRYRTRSSLFVDLWIKQSTFVVFCGSSSTG